ncbi:hypothetical protein GRI89_08115 [Altererythrobacter salegens]|uniref:Uncharacterized protein n=1 Tax=Croceibacterium salegens TaxID=1737568 RepID=A0A6I4STY4_9SPHN|nr:hypothetical protein [Croceibacterium salegens]MXO59504.1 hypothetical protein [Croceibacterium salegens]
MSKESLIARSVLAMLLAASSAASAGQLGKPVIGPQLVCFKYNTFSLNNGERLTEVPGSSEEISVLVASSKSELRIAEGEVWADTKKDKQRILQRGKTSVYRIVSEPRYAIYDPLDYETNKLLIWLSGSALKGNDEDNAIVSRFKIEDAERVECQHQFTYSS